MLYDYHNRKVREKLSKFLKGKRVIVVGPAPSIIGSKQGDLINQYDVVVRLNKALPVPKDLQSDIGRKTDILYNCMNPSEECGGTISLGQLKKYNVKFLVAAYPPVDKMESTKLRTRKDNFDFYQKNKSKFPNYCHTDKNHFKKLWTEMKLPNTGIMAILDLLRFDIKELYITGITFFKGGYYSKYRKYNEEEVLKHMKRFNLHKQDKQLSYMAHILSKDKRVKMDGALQKIISDEINKSDQLIEEDKTIIEINVDKKEDKSNNAEKSNVNVREKSNVDKKSEVSKYNEDMLLRLTRDSVNLYTRRVSVVAE